MVKMFVNGYLSLGCVETSWETHDTIICSALATEVKGLVIFDAVVDHAVREHGLIGDAEYEHPEGEVVGWLGVSPHS